MDQRPFSSISQFGTGPLLMPRGIRNDPAGRGSENMRQPEHGDDGPWANAPHTSWAHEPPPTDVYEIARRPLASNPNAWVVPSCEILNPRLPLSHSV